MLELLLVTMVSHRVQWLPCASRVCIHRYIYIYVYVYAHTYFLFPCSQFMATTRKPLDSDVICPEDSSTIPTVSRMCRIEPHQQIAVLLCFGGFNHRFPEPSLLVGAYRNTYPLYIYIYIEIEKHMYVYIYTVHISTQYVCRCKHARINICTCIHIHMTIFVHLRIGEYVYMYVSRFMHACMHACMHTYMRTYIHTCIHTYMFVIRSCL